MEKVVQQTSVQVQPEALDQFTAASVKAGCPTDQVERFVAYMYIPLLWQWNFHAGARLADKPGGPTMLGVGGARGPGKSHAVFAQMTVDDCQRVDNLKGLFLRQTGLSAQESFEDLVAKVLERRVKHTYNRSANKLVFPNNSRILLGGFKDEKDIDKYIGIEYDFIAVEELNQLTEEKLRKIRGSMRTSKPNWRPRLYTSFNPGGKGHAFVKDLFVIPFRSHRETDTRFYPSTYKANPYLNPEYIDYLEGLPGDLGRAWREGDFDLFEGQFFSEWRPILNDKAYHVVPHEAPTEGNKIFIGVDWGYFPGWFAALWFEVLPNRRLYVFREAYFQRQHAYNAALQLIRMSREPVAYLKADPSIWSKRNLITGQGDRNPPSIADEFIRAGIPRDILQAANNDRINGWDMVHRYLAPANDGLPWLVISERCENLIRTLPSMVHDETNPEDMETDDVEDHLPDALRYGIMSRPFRSAGSLLRSQAATWEELQRKTFEVDEQGRMPNIYSELMKGDQTELAEGEESFDDIVR